MHFHLVHLVRHLAPSFGHVGRLTYWIAFLAALLESMAFIGSVIPGSTIIMIAGFAANRGVIGPVDLLWFVVAGAVIGDGLSYYLGTKGTRFFKEENKLLKASYLRKGEVFFKKHGSKSVFLGRFAPPLRAIIPFIAGASSMEVKLFIFWNVASAFAWGSVIIAVGYFFGSAYRTIEHWISRTSLLIIGIAVLGFLIWHTVKRGLPYLSILAETLRSNQRSKK